MANMLPSSSISLEPHKRCNRQPMSSRGIDEAPPSKKQKQPLSPPVAPSNLFPYLTQPPWPVRQQVRKSMVRSFIETLIQPRFGMLWKEAKVVAEKIEDEAYKEATAAAADISPVERQSMYTNLLDTQLAKYALSHSEFLAKIESDPRYAVMRNDEFCNYYFELDPELEPSDAAQRKPKVEQAQLQTPPGQWDTTTSQQQQDSGVSSHESLEAIQAIFRDKAKLGQVLVQHPKLLEILKEKLEQQQ